MSKDKKNQDTQGKELSEWQKRNQEYLQKKAEEEAQLAKEKAQTDANKKEDEKASDEDTNLSEWQKQNREYLRQKAEEEAKEEQESDLSEDTEVEDDSDSNPEEQKEITEDESSPEEEETTETEQGEEEDEKSDEAKVEEKRSKSKKKIAKPSIPSVHIWRAVTILIPSLLVMFFSIYLLTPFSTLKNIEVTGTVETNADQIKEASGIRDSDYTFSLLLNKDKHAEMIKSNHWIESASIHYQFPTNFTIQVKEYGIVAYYVSGEDSF